MGQGRLVLVGTPLGNRADLSPRAAAAITGADELFCEDTRSVPRLLGTETPLPPRRSFFAGNEAQRCGELVDLLSAGREVVFVSEAGMPIWSDPGRALVEAALGGGFVVDVIPGPTAAATALCLTPFVAEGARFLGFVPRDSGPRKSVLRTLARDRGAAIFYESPNRVAALLRDLETVLGEDAKQRRVAVARELTKLHQEVKRGTVAELAAQIQAPLRGEVTVVLEGYRGVDEEAEDAKSAAREVLETMLDPTLKPRPKAKRLAELTGGDAREIYDRLRDARDSS